MNKLLIFLFVSLLTLTANAQSLDGTWVADEEFHELLSNFIDDENTEVGFGLLIDDNEINIIVTISVSVEEMSVDCAVVIPGIYSRTGDWVKCQFSNEDVDFKVLEVESDDDEIQALLNDEESHDAVISLIEGMLKENLESSFSDISEITDIFNVFTVTNQSSDTFTIETEEGAEISFISVDD